jgi:hypothetical protein
VKTIALHTGCCERGQRCVLCSPQGQVDTDEVVRVLLEQHEGPVHAFGGAPPKDAWMALFTGRDVRVRVRPDLLSRRRAEELVRQGVVRIELDALSVNDRLLRWSRRRYRGSRIVTMTKAMRSWGIEVGVVQALGLPAGTLEDALADAITLAPLVDTVRIHPVLVLAEADLEQQWTDSRYFPLTINAAALWSRQVMEIYEAHNVTVLRVGMQPGPDGLGRAVAGPLHPSLRETVESHRALSRLTALLSDVPNGADVVIECAPADVSRTKGAENHNVRVLRDTYRLASVTVAADPDLERGHHRVRRTTQ